MKEQTRSYKDLVRQNMRLNSELRKIGSQLNRNHNYSSSKIDLGEKYRLKQLKYSQTRELERKKQEQLKNYKILLSLKKHDSANKNSTDDSAKLEPPRRKHSEMSSKGSSSPLKLQNIYKTNEFANEEGKKKNMKKFLSQEIQNSQALNLLRNSQISPIQNSPGSELFKIYQKKEKFQRMLNLSALNAADIKKNDDQLLKWIRQNIIGFNTSYISAVHLPIETVYVDHTATNRPFKAVEILVDHAKLFAANPHTEFSRFGKFSTQLMHYARDSLLKSFGTSTDTYCVLPTGGGSTGAIQKAVHFLKGLETHGQNWSNPMIFLTPYEHHSNILPWVEFYQKLQILAHDDVGTLYLDQLYDQISQCESSSIIVSISAASNVTSKVTHLKEFNQIISNNKLYAEKLRQLENKKFIFSVDCAAFCCHHDLNLSIYDEIDFAFLSPHKNLGGAQSCGLLVARKSLMSMSKPTFPGGGTVKFVKGYKRDDVMYEVDIFSRQIAGTPPYLGFYRAALSFQLLKNVIGYDFIHKGQYRNTKLFFEMIDAANAELKAEGNDTVINIYGERDLNERANVITFNYQYGKFSFVQHSLASLVLTDIFGIQIRSGCFCAGPYGIQLLKIQQEMVDNIQSQLEAGIMINKPGYLRLDLTFYLEQYQVEYIAKAVIIIGRYWRSLLRLYTVCNGGEVILLPVFKKNQVQIYSLSQMQEAYEKLQQESKDHDYKMKNRRATLENQLKIGESIAKNPLEFLKGFKNNKCKNLNAEH